MKYLFLPLIISCIFALRANALPITVDPSGPALTGTYAVEWNTNGNLESWTTSQVTGATVNGGQLSGTTNGTSPRVIRSNFSGPDQDFLWYDWHNGVQRGAGVGHPRCVGADGWSISHLPH